MGIRKRDYNEPEPCSECGLVISFSEYLLMKWLDTDSMEKRKAHCEQYHTELLQRQKQGSYDYEWSFRKQTAAVSTETN
jgi:hypothetical protein